MHYGVIALITALALSMLGCKSPPLETPAPAPSPSDTVQAESFPSNAANHAAPDTSAPNPETQEARTPQKTEQELEINAWIRELTSRQKCNRVMGCASKQALVTLGEPCVAPLLNVLEKSVPIAPFRPVVIETLGLIGSKKALSILTKELASPLWPNRTATAIALGRIGAPESLVSLQALLAQDSTAQAATRAAAGYALVKLGHAEQKQEVLNLLTPKAIQTVNWGYTNVAVELATELKIRAGLPGMREGLQHKDFFLRRSSLRGVVAFQDPKAIPYLIPLLEDPIPSLRRESLAALIQLTGQDLRSKEEWNGWCQTDKSCHKTSR